MSRNLGVLHLKKKKKTPRCLLQKVKVFNIHSEPSRSLIKLMNPSRMRVTQTCTNPSHRWSRSIIDSFLNLFFIRVSIACLRRRYLNVNYTNTTLRFPRYSSSQDFLYRRLLRYLQRLCSALALSDPVVHLRKRERKFEDWYSPSLGIILVLFVYCLFKTLTLSFNYLKRPIDDHLALLRSETLESSHAVRRPQFLNPSICWIYLWTVDPDCLEFFDKHRNEDESCQFQLRNLRCVNRRRCWFPSVSVPLHPSRPLQNPPSFPFHGPLRIHSHRAQSKIHSPLVKQKNRIWPLQQNLFTFQRNSIIFSPKSWVSIAQVRKYFGIFG